MRFKTDIVAGFPRGPGLVAASSTPGFARGGRTLADLDIRVVAVLDHLAQLAHVESLTASWALHEVIGLGLGDAVGVNAGVARDQNHSMTSYPKATPSGSFSWNDLSAASGSANTLR